MIITYEMVPDNVKNNVDNRFGTGGKICGSVSDDLRILIVGF